jgi:hypothetical protein
MERTLAGIRTGEDVKLAETEDFYTPKNKIEILGNTLQFIGLNGFGLLSGLNVVIDGGFDEIQKFLEERGVKYTRCDGDKSLHLKVCHQDITDRCGHVIMTHPYNPKLQVILICANKKTKSG